MENIGRRAARQRIKLVIILFALVITAALSVGQTASADGVGAGPPDWHGTDYFRYRKQGHLWGSLGTVASKGIVSVHINNTRTMHAPA